MGLASLKPRVSVARIARAATLTTGAHQRPRGAAWRRLRDEVMREACGLCQCDHCASLPVRCIAHVVDHRTPLWAGGSPTDRDNLMAMNDDCHKRKTALEAAQRAQGGA